MAEIIKREVIQMDKIYNVYHDGTRKKRHTHRYVTISDFYPMPDLYASQPQARYHSQQANRTRLEHYSEP